MSAKKILGAVLVVAAVAVAVFAPEFLPALIPGISSLGVAAITAGLEIGIGLTQSLLLGPSKPKMPGTNPLSRLFATLDTTASRKIVFGHTAMATDVRYQTYSGTNQEFYEQIIAVASHQVESIDEIWIDNEKAWTKTGGVQGRYVGYLTVETRELGTSSNGIAIDSVWTATATLTGCAYVHLKYKLVGPDSSTASPFQGGVSSRLTIRGKGALVYDPRLDSTVAGGSGTMRADDQTTWAWDDDGSRNPALQELFYELGWTINGKLAVGKGLPPSRLDLSSYVTAANLCDEAVALKAGGTEPRYRSDGVLSEGDDPPAVRETICATMNATLRDNGGAIAIAVLHDDLASVVTPLEAALSDEALNVPATSFGGTLAARTTTYAGFAATDLFVVSKPSVLQDGRLSWDAWSAWSSDGATTPTPPPVVGQTWNNEFQVYGNNGGSDVLLFDPTLDADLYATESEAFAALAAQMPVSFAGYTTYKIVAPSDPNPGDNRNGLSLRIQRLSPRSAFDERDILGDEEWEQTPPLSDSFNIARGRYVDPSDSALYQLSDIPEQALASTDGIDRIQSVDLIMVQSPTQGQRLLKLRLMRGQYQGRYSFTGKPSWWAVNIGQVVAQSHPGLSWTEKLLRCALQGIARTGETKLALVEENSAIYAWDPATDEKSALSAGSGTVADPANNPLLPGASTVTQMIAASHMEGMTFTIADTGDVTVSTHQRIYPDKTVTVNGATVTAPAGTSAGDEVAVYYDDPDRLGGTVSYQMLRLAGGTGSLAAATYSTTNPARHFVCAGIVPASGGQGSGGSDVGSGGTGATALIGAYSTGEVDALLAASPWKKAVRAKTAAALPANTYANGTAGVGAALTGSANGALAAVDGVTLTAGDRLLVDQEATAAHNGIYVLTQLGDASHPYILTRATDADEAAELVNAACKVSEGGSFADQEWQCTTNAPITVGTTGLVWAEAGGSASLALNDLTDVDTATTAPSLGDVLTFNGAGEWVPEAPVSGGGALTLISRVVTSGSQASVSFSSIPATYRDLIIVVSGRGTNASANVVARVQFNGDAGPNYSFENVNWTSNVAAAAQSTAQNFLQMASQLPGASATANYSGNASMRIFDYRGTTFFKSILSEGGGSLGSGATTQQLGFYGGAWASLAAISSIVVALNAGSFVNGSVVSLYGVS